MLEVKCVDCESLFTIDDKEQAWYKEMNFELPKRCPACRKERKELRKKQYEQKKGYSNKKAKE